MLYTTQAQYEEAIADTATAIQRIMLTGYENENLSGGSSRRIKEASLSQLEKHMQTLQKEYAELLRGQTSFVMGMGW